MKLADIFAVAADARAEGRPFDELLAQAGDAAVAFAVFHPHGRPELPSGPLSFTGETGGDGFSVGVSSDGERYTLTWGYRPVDARGVPVRPGKLHPGGYLERLTFVVETFEPNAYYRVRIPISETDVDFGTSDVGVGAGGEAARVRVLESFTSAAGGDRYR